MLTGTRAGIDVNGRVGQARAEQQSCLAEHHGSQLSRPSRSAELEDEGDQHARCDAELFGRLSIAEHQSWLRDRRATRGLDHEGGERHEHRTRRRPGWREHRSVPHEGEQIEEPRTEPHHPQANGQGTDVITSGDVRDRSALLDGRDRREDHLDAGDLARERIIRQHTLAMTAVPASGKRDRKHHETGSGVQLSQYATSRQTQV